FKRPILNGKAPCVASREAATPDRSLWHHRDQRRHMLCCSAASPPPKWSRQLLPDVPGRVSWSSFIRQRFRFLCGALEHGTDRHFSSARGRSHYPPILLVACHTILADRSCARGSQRSPAQRMGARDRSRTRQGLLYRELRHRTKNDF